MSTQHQRVQRGQGCGAPAAVGSHPRLNSIVRAYIARCRANSEDELGSFKAEPNLATAVERAGRAEMPGGRRYHHQRRLPAALLRFATKELRRGGLGRARSFDELHQLVHDAIGLLHGIGELTVYDTALRIGAKLGHLPKRVYLHSGTRAGARALGLDWRASFLEVRDVPSELRVLRPHEIEDCLCIFKDKFSSAV